MNDPIQELRVRAEILHGRMDWGEEESLQRLRVLPQFRRSTVADLKSVPTRRQDCLAVIAAELGFSSWTQAKRVIAGDEPGSEFGTILNPPRTAVHLNRWYANYERAAADHNSGYLLGYRRQCFIVDRYYIESLKLHPEDPDWATIGFDWVRPKDLAARTRLYSKLIAVLPRAS